MPRLCKEPATCKHEAGPFGSHRHKEALVPALKMGELGFRTNTSVLTDPQRKGRKEKGLWDSRGKDYSFWLGWREEDSGRVMKEVVSAQGLESWGGFGNVKKQAAFFGS